MICARCGHETIAKLADSPVPDAWEVHQCARCLYTWRTTEPARRTERALFPEEFKLTEAAIEAAVEVPTVPPLRRGGDLA